MNKQTQLGNLRESSSLRRNEIGVINQPAEKNRGIYYRDSQIPKSVMLTQLSWEAE